jgi:negative regulator of replication initiation
MIHIIMVYQEMAYLIETDQQDKPDNAPNTPLWHFNKKN